MIFALFIGVVLFAGAFRTDLFWELLTGCALLGIPVALAAGDLGTAAASLLFLAGCCWHWSRVA